MTIRQKKFDPSHPAFHGHSESLKPTRIDRLPIDFLLVIHISYRFRYKRRFRSKVANSSHERRFSLEFCNGGGTQKPRVMPY